MPSEWTLRLASATTISLVIPRSDLQVPTKHGCGVRTTVTGNARGAPGSNSYPAAGISTPRERGHRAKHTDLPSGRVLGVVLMEELGTQTYCQRAALELAALVTHQRRPRGRERHDS